MTDLLVVSPVYGDSPHGAATYYGLLLPALRERGYKSVVVTERQTRGSDHTIGLFPPRANQPGRSWGARWAYARQNLSYRKLPGIVAKLEPRVILLHAGFLAHPALLNGPLMAIRDWAGNHSARMVLDVRDRLASRSRLKRQRYFDRVISCSLGVTEHLLESGIPGEKIRLIPIPQGPLEIDPDRARAVRRELGIGERFLLSVGLVKEEKGSLALATAFLEQIRPTHPEVELVFAGLDKSRSPRLQQALHSPGIRHVGKLPRAGVLGLMQCADVCVNPSPSEGLPRASLEALALRRPVVLPKGVAEFERECPDFCLRQGGSEEIAKLCIARLADGAVAGYDVAQHSLERTVPDYVEWLFDS